MVGCVLVRDGVVVGEGWHHRAGEPHAEVEALRAVVSPDGARGATAYVTLEPCNHHGRTGPCTEALLGAGVARVVVAMGDPNPHVRGGGAERLRAAGVPVENGLLEAEARAQNAGFVRWVTTGRPRVTLKAGLSLDGRIAAASGDARWVTGDAARLEVHRLRDACDAILVGAGTVRTDDPELTTRLPGGGGRDPLRVILDGGLTIPPSARVVRPGTLIAATQAAPADAEQALASRGAEVLRLPSEAAAPGRVALGPLLDALGKRGVLELLVEGGADVHGAFVAAGLADRLVAFIAPRLVGDAGVPLLRLPAERQPGRMADAITLRGVSMQRVGDDMMLTAFFDGERALQASSASPASNVKQGS
jgi:diaminohydroxyphosphoribosylaminopyrimidine deaminase/5-amino-6-(5-phosphoribosylamino)uracil reductase